MIILILSCSAAQAAEKDILTDQTHTIGETFSRSFINKSNISSLPESVLPFAKSVARFGRGTAFYIGSQSDRHFMMTAAHTALGSLAREKLGERASLLNKPTTLCKVFPSEQNSDFREFHLVLAGVYVTCKKLVYINEETDTAVFEINIHDQNMPEPIKIEAQVQPLEFGTQLGFFSYSSFENLGTNGEFDLVYSSDSDCRNFTSDKYDTVSSVSIIDDKEILHKVFTVGCDFVGGDSGGPVLNLETGALVGMVFAQRSEGLRKIGKNRLSLLENFVELPEARQKNIASRYLNYMSILDSEIIELVF